MHSVEDTIAALASPAGAGARAIVRVSGPQTRAVLETVFQPGDPHRWQCSRRPERHTGRMTLTDWRTCIPADVLLWPGQRSYTGAPAAEIGISGSPPLVEALLRTVYQAGARPARAGEFTLRAFLAGRLDLLQAEAVLGVIDAEDHLQLRQALDQLAGGLSGDIAHIREQLLLHLADLEAGLDFVDEDIEFVSRATLASHLSAASARIETLAAQARDRLASSSRRQVVLAGLPNAGKSTLFNRLAARDAAIVSDRPGTTRDALCADLVLDGIAIQLWDTAGWDESSAPSAARRATTLVADVSDPIMAIAGDVRTDRLARADLIVWCTAADLTPDDRLSDADHFRNLPGNIPIVRLKTRADLSPTAESELSVSAATGHGLERFRAVLREQLTSAAAHHGELLGSTAARCRESLRRAAASLNSARQTLECGGGDELVSVDLRSALDALGEVCGAVYTDDILDRIFSRFCIGK